MLTLSIYRYQWHIRHLSDNTSLTTGMVYILTVQRKECMSEIHTYREETKSMRKLLQISQRYTSQCDQSISTVSVACPGWTQSLNTSKTMAFSVTNYSVSASLGKQLSSHRTYRTHEPQTLGRCDCLRRMLQLHDIIWLVETMSIC